MLFPTNDFSPVEGDFDPLEVFHWSREVHWLMLPNLGRKVVGYPLEEVTPD